MPKRLLLIDADEASNAKLRGYFAEIIPKAHIDVVGALAQAKSAIETAPYDFIISELELTDSEGISTLEALINSGGSAPILVHSAIEDQSRAIRAVQLGAQDYLVKGRGNALTFQRIIQHSMERMRLVREVENAKDTLEQKVEERTRDLAAAMTMLHDAVSAKEEFFSNMTHELRTPLHAIINFSRFCSKKIETASQEKLKGYFDDIHLSGQRLLGLVNDILDLTKENSGMAELSREQTDIAELIREVQREMSSMLEQKNLTLDVFVAPECAHLNIDRRRIYQVLLNLISNAYKFSAENAVIDVRAELTRDNDGSPHATISVIDEGIGIPEGELDSVFDEFAQSNKVKSGEFHAGTGLGLAICRQIVHAHGGSIKAELNPRGGTIICFALPLTQTKH
jgi:signal transduction histidine kinase